MKTVFRHAASSLLLLVMLIVVVAANTTYTIHTLDELAALERRLFTTNQIINSINTLHLAILRTESGQRGFLMSNDESYLEDYESTLNQVNSIIQKVEDNAIKSNHDQQEDRLKTLIKLAKAKLAELIETVELNRNGRRDEAIAIFQSGTGLALYDQFEQEFNNIDAEEHRLQSQHVDSLLQLRSNSETNLIISSISTGLLVVTIFVLLRINIRETIRHRKELQQHNLVLESRVQERTVELQVYAEELSRSNRELEDFAFVASHDLQEPLRKIRAFGNRISTGYEDALDERGQDFLRRMLNAAERMSMLISDLLSFSRVTTRGKDFADTDLNDILSSVLDDLEITIEEANADVEVSELPVMKADAVQMNQLFLNLLSNALKFVKPGVAPKITLTYAPVDDDVAKSLHLLPGLKWFKLTLQDNGIGFDQSFADKIFAPFQRLHGRSEYKGTGIGLAVCRRIVERHNGTIQAFSEPEQGARFDLYLPEDGQPFTSQQQGVMNHAKE